MEDEGSMDTEEENDGVEIEEDDIKEGDEDEGASHFEGECIRFKQGDTETILFGHDVEVHLKGGKVTLPANSPIKIQ